MKNNIVRSCVVLFIISAVCVLALAYVNEITAEPIRLQEEMAENQAYKELFPDASEYKKGEMPAPEGGEISEIITAYKAGEVDGYIVKLGQKGFGGTISMMVGLKNDGSLSAIKLLSHSETPGLGANAEKPDFTDQFKGKAQFPLSVVKSGTAGADQILAITSSTITSTAVTDAVNTAQKWFAEEGGVK